jgi:hypothetical protein
VLLGLDLMLLFQNNLLKMQYAVSRISKWTLTEPYSSCDRSIKLSS